MKKSSIAIILFLVSLATICSTYAESGPPPLQEVEATGQGANADDAFKQAVNDAVRQVVGTLVSAENLINNDRIIKDEVLTLSNGFVEKVLSQGKTKLADGTWQVKLKCIVRKGQVFTRLQEAKVPTVKFDGVSLFADVVSQIEVQKNSAELLSRAFEDFSSFLVAAKVLNPKPRIVARDENATEIEIDCQAVCDLDRFFSQVAPKLEQALDKTCVGKPMELTDTSSETRRLDISGQKVLTFAPDPFKPRLFGTTRSPIQEEAAPDGHYTVGLPVKGGKDLKKWSYKLYDMDKRLFATWPRRNKAYNGSQQTLGFLRDSAVVFAILVDKNGQYLGVMNVG